jgi:hypothetical protein
VTRPAILLRAAGRFQDGRYIGYAKCERCGYIDCMPDGRSELEVAHLEIPPGEPGHDAHANLAALCHACHRAHDYDAWVLSTAETRTERKDRARPILEFLRRGRARKSVLDLQFPKDTDEFGRLLGWQDSLVEEALEAESAPRKD